ncbi:hypothetical protein SAMN05518684_104225 [Salipaludibacillus aurantiacus]|uniref:Uncharacterized protein n=1 Tax=Salipaludibacillus aurantiacus TaxID=1601833 RepID=A0A1H9SHK1_9BACI|nr:hypothetical protein SAMN05518684_104225 [Salipaludibacillus aurantiacus]
MGAGSGLGMETDLGRGLELKLKSGEKCRKLLYGRVAHLYGRVVCLYGRVAHLYGRVVCLYGRVPQL